MSKLTKIPKLISYTAFRWTAMGRLYKLWTAKEYEALISLCNLMLSKNPTDYLAFYYRGLGNEELKQFDLAIDDFMTSEKILTTNKRNNLVRDYFTRIPIQISRVYRKKHDKEKTIEYADKEFELRLADLTRIGEPTIMGTPFALFAIFDFSDKPFYGVFDKSKFQLARNKVLPFPTGYIVNGTYTKSDNKTILNYEIKPIAFSYYCIRTAPVLFFLFINAVLFFNLNTFELDVILTVNGFALIMTILALTVDRFQKKRIDKMFQKAFEVEY